MVNYKTKGDPVFIEGRLEQQSWTAQDGTNRSKHVVVAETIQYLSSGNGNGSSGGASGGAGGGSKQGAGQDAGGDFAEEDFEPDDIPFRALNARRRVVSDIL